MNGVVQLDFVCCGAAGGTVNGVDLGAADGFTAGVTAPGRSVAAISGGLDDAEAASTVIETIDPAGGGAETEATPDEPSRDVFRPVPTTSATVTATPTAAAPPPTTLAVQVRALVAALAPLVTPATG